MIFLNAITSVVEMKSENKSADHHRRRSSQLQLDLEPSAELCAIDLWVIFAASERRELRIKSETFLARAITLGSIDKQKLSRSIKGKP
jgi:hypothetical protein